MSDKRRLIFSIIQFCNKELQSNDLSDDAKESLEVASQCLQSAYSLTPEDKHLEVSKPLETIFQDATKAEPVSLPLLVYFFNKNFIQNFIQGTSSFFVFFCSFTKRRLPPRPIRKRQKG